MPKKRDRFDEYIANAPHLKRVSAPKFLTEGFHQEIKKKRKKRLIDTNNRLKLLHESKAVERELTTIEKEREITHGQRIAINLLLDYHNRWPMEFVADQAGCTLTTLYRWKNHPRFLAELDREITKRRTYMRREAFFKFFDMIKRGEYRALRDYFKMTGDLREHAVKPDEPTQIDDDQALDSEIKRLADELGFDLPEPRNNSS